MAHYSLYFPERQGSTPEHLTRVGLGCLLKDGAPEFADLDRGPDGKSGVMCTWRNMEIPTDEHPHLGFSKERQHWEPCAVSDKDGVAKGDFWIGFEEEKKPRPLDLQWNELHDGYRLVLGDGNEWLIPTMEALPQTFGIDVDSGKMVSEPTEEYEDFCRRTNEYASIILNELGMLDRLYKARPDKAPDESQVEFSLEDCFEYCCDALLINYRVHWQVINAMRPRILTQKIVMQVLLATFDYHNIIDVREDKKKDHILFIPVGSNIFDGDGTPVLAQ